MFAKIRGEINSPIRVHEIRHSVATILGADRDIPFADSAKFLWHPKEVFIKYYVHAQKESNSDIGKKLTSGHQGQPGTVKENASLYIIRPNFAPKLAPTILSKTASSKRKNRWERVLAVLFLFICF